MTRMPERSFFDRRYTFPGYTFILLIVLMNLKAFFSALPSVTDVISSLLGIFLGFVTLLSGAPLGFLVSQTWYVIFNWRKESYVCKEEAPFDAFTLLWRAYRSAEESGNRKPTREEKRRLVAISSNITHSWEPRGDDVFVTRRWDLLILVGSTAVAIVEGLLVGLIVRKVIVEPNITLDSLRVSLLGMSLGVYCMFDWCVPIVALLALIPLWLVYGRVLREHLSMFRFMVWSFLRIADLADLGNDSQLEKSTELYEKYVKIKRASDLHRNYFQNGQDDTSIDPECR